MARWLVTLAALIALASAQAQEIKIGVAGPITGPLAFLGQHMKWAGELATDELNQQGGVSGRKFVFLMQDSACRPADGVAAAERLLSQDNVDVMLGDVCSGSTMAIMPVIAKAQKPYIVTVSTHPDITQKAGAGGKPHEAVPAIRHEHPAHRPAAARLGRGRRSREERQVRRLVDRLSVLRQ